MFNFQGKHKYTWLKPACENTVRWDKQQAISTNDNSHSQCHMVSQDPNELKYMPQHHMVSLGPSELQHVSKIFKVPIYQAASLVLISKIAAWAHFTYTFLTVT